MATIIEVPATSTKPEIVTYPLSIGVSPMNTFDYLSETDLTASGVFTPGNIGKEELITIIDQMVGLGQNMDNIKKAMFRKRTRAESGLEPLTILDDRLEVDDKLADLFHGVIGCITEVGELAEILLKYLDGFGEPDAVNIHEEIGDVLWYLARLVKYSNTSFDTEMRRNIKKLRARHGNNGFDRDRDINRDLDNERNLLEE